MAKSISKNAAKAVGFFINTQRILEREVQK
jgi:hypothetical protein